MICRLLDISKRGNVRVSPFPRRWAPRASIGDISISLGMSRPKRPPIATPKPDPLKMLLIRVPEQLHVRLKVAAAREGKPMAELVTNAITTYLRATGA